MYFPLQVWRYHSTDFKLVHHVNTTCPAAGVEHELVLKPAEQTIVQPGDILGYTHYDTEPVRYSVATIDPHWFQYYDFSGAALNFEIGMVLTPTTEHGGRRYNIQLIYQTQCKSGYLVDHKVVSLTGF